MTGSGSGSGQEFEWSISGVSGEVDDGSGSVPTPTPPEVIDRYRIQGELGRGGMGVVYRARDMDLNIDVALKVILDRGYEPDSSRRNRFEREGQVTAALNHPGIVKVLRAGEVLGQPYLAYELVDQARSLAEAFEGAGLAQRVEWLRDAARALGHAHAQGVLHRDVKPDNILLDRTRRVRVTDFGLAAGVGLDRLTRTGALVGTPTYAAPELLMAERAAVGPWTDVWSLGVILYQALTDALPFDSHSLIELAGLVTESEPAPIRSLNPSAPLDLVAVCGRALRKAPAERYPNADAFADDLDAWLKATPVSAAHAAARPPRRWLLPVLSLLAVAALGLVGGWVLGRRGPAPTSTPGATPTPAGLALTLSDLPGLVHTRTLRVTGRVRTDAWPVVVRVQRREQTLQRGETISLEVPLEWGSTTVRIEATDRRGRTASAERVVVRGHPSWVAARWDDPRKRPPGPLPNGVSYGEHPAEFVNDKDGSVLVWVPPGVFVAGWDRGTDMERPQHQVTLRRGFFIGKYEVTIGQYARFVRETHYQKPVRPDWAPTDDHPVVFVSWEDARAYCAWAGLRLPTDAQWGLAARGVRNRRFPWGNSPLGGRYLNAKGTGDRFEFTAPVGSFPGGAAYCGALDMAGNVFEWVLDGMARYPKRPQVDPFLDPTPAPARPIRGGAYNVEVQYCRTTYRDAAAPLTWTSWIGFRVARLSY